MINLVKKNLIKFYINYNKNNQFNFYKSEFLKLNNLLSKM